MLSQIPDEVQELHSKRESIYGPDGSNLTKGPWEQFGHLLDFLERREIQKVGRHLSSDVIERCGLTEEEAKRFEALHIDVLAANSKLFGERMEVVPRGEESMPGTHEFRIPALPETEREAIFAELDEALVAEFGEIKGAKLKAERGIFDVHGYFAAWGLRETVIVVRDDLSEVVNFIIRDGDSDDITVHRTGARVGFDQPGSFGSYGYEAMKRIYDTIHERRRVAKLDSL